MLHSKPALAETSLVPQPTILTPTLLQERLIAPKLDDGVYSIDLTHLIIDLTQPDLSEEFYRSLQTQITRSSKPLGLDLSYSVIKGDFFAGKLGLLTSFSTGTLSPLLSPDEKEQIKRDERFLHSPKEQSLNPLVTVFRGIIRLDHVRFTGKVDFSNSFFLQYVWAQKTTFVQGADWSKNSFASTVDFSGAHFTNEANFGADSFFAKVNFKAAFFKAVANFSGANFQAETSFATSQFDQPIKFNRVKFFGIADFTGINCRDRVNFAKSGFLDSSNFNNAVFAKSVVFRGTIFNKTAHFQDVTLLDQVDFSNAFFAKKAKLNVSGLAFDSQQAKILGDDGVIGRALSLPRLEGNESVLRNLIRNFRLLQQLTDANQVEYTKQKLTQQQLASNLLNPKFTPPERLRFLLLYLFLSLLLLLSNYGNSIGLVLAVGLVAIALGALLFWFVDRYRRRYPTPIVPSFSEAIVMGCSFIVLNLIALVQIFYTSAQPLSTLACLEIFLLPLPVVSVYLLYLQGRYHDLMDVSYLVEEGSLRQLRLLIVRLPITPRFPMFNERYLPITWSRRWSWLCYYDFSLNNILRLGFNDIRLRDQAVPGLVSFLVWYQWLLGVLYFALLLWTLSRRIPGLNLLIYLR